MQDERDIAETLTYIAGRPELFSKEEMVGLMKEAAQVIRDLRLLVGAWQKLELKESDPKGNA